MTMEPLINVLLRLKPEVFYHRLLINVLDDLMDLVGGFEFTKKVKKATKEISERYTVGLSSQSRYDWSVPAHRCAYVFMYLMQHCHLMSYSLQKTSKWLESWHTNKEVLKVCSIGGGPGSDLVGLTTFLRKNKIFPTSHLECLVLDRYAEWKDTWDKIGNHIPGLKDLKDLKVEYTECDVVGDKYKDLTKSTRQFIEQADMLTFVKFFSAVSAFFQDDKGSGDLLQSKGSGGLLQSILCKIKPGCLVLYIDNDDTNKQFEKKFAAGLSKKAEFQDTITLSIGTYSDTLQKYSDALEWSPLGTCNVLIQLYEKLAV